jgi:hypothetical protein
MYCRTQSQKRTTYIHNNKLTESTLHKSTLSSGHSGWLDSGLGRKRERRKGEDGERRRTVRGGYVLHSSEVACDQSWTQGRFESNLRQRLNGECHCSQSHRDMYLPIVVTGNISVFLCLSVCWEYFLPSRQPASVSLSLKVWGRSPLDQWYSRYRHTIYWGCFALNNVLSLVLCVLTATTTQEQITQ